MDEVARQALDALIERGRRAGQWPIVPLQCPACLQGTARASLVLRCRSQGLHPSVGGRLLRAWRTALWAWREPLQEPGAAPVRDLRDVA